MGKDRYVVQTFGNEVIDLDPGHVYTATTLDGAGDCDHSVSWKTDTRFEIIRDVTLAMKNGPKVKLDLEIVGYNLEPKIVKVGTCVAHMA